VPANSIESDTTPGGIMNRDMAQNLPLTDNAVNAPALEVIIRPEGGSTPPAVTTAWQRCRTSGDHGYDKGYVGNQLSHDTLARGLPAQLISEIFLEHSVA
jgi:hypothetical protein